MKNYKSIPNNYLHGEIMKEVWKDVPGFEGYYQASTLGRVRSVERIQVRSNGWPYKVQSKVLTPTKDGNGYLRTAFSVNSKLTTIKIHRVVAITFLGRTELEVNHIDGDKTNNRSTNIEYCTRSENLKHSYRIGLQKPRRGSSNNKAKLHEKDIPFIRELFKAGKTSREIAAIYKMDKTVFLDIKNGKIWKHV